MVEKLLSAWVEFRKEKRGIVISLLRSCCFGLIEVLGSLWLYVDWPWEGCSHPSSSEELKINLCDLLREEMVERYSILCELLNGDVGFFVNLNSIKEIMSLLCSLLSYHIILACLVHTFYTYCLRLLNLVASFLSTPSIASICEYLFLNTYNAILFSYWPPK